MRKIKNMQVNITLPCCWVNKLEEISHEYSFKENKNLNIQDLVRRAVEEKYQLKDIKEIKDNG